MQVIHTRSVHETQQLQSALRERMTGEHTGGARFTWRATNVAVRDLSISTSSYTGSVRGHADEVARYWLSVTTSAGGRASQGHDTATFGAGAGNIVSPGMALDVSLGEGFSGILMGIPVPTMERTLTALHGRPIRAPRFSLPLDFTMGAAADVARLLRFVAGEAERKSILVETPAIAGRLEEAIVLAVLQLPHELSQPGVKVESRFALELVKRVEEYVAAHAADPITLAELAQIAGVGIRTLQGLFQRHRGSTPMAFLRARRLELARARLASNDAASIAEIAFACGFTHLGRFSVAYRARFGERPTETRLRRSRAAAS